MTVEEAIQARIAGLSPVMALVGSRVYLEVLPQSPTYPAVRVTEISDEKTQHLRGPDGLCYGHVQIDAFGSRTSGVDARAQAMSVLDAIHGDGLGPNATGVFGWIGSIGSPAFEIKNCEFLDRSGSWEAGELQVFMATLEYRVWYRA